MSKLKLRDYQQKYHVVNEERLTTLEQTCHINVLPTGGGKSLLIAHQIFREISRGKRIIFLSHRQELLDNIANIAKNDLNIKFNLKNSKLYICNIQSYKSFEKKFNLNPGFIKTIIIDEVHHALSDTYEKVLSFYKNHGCNIIGYTATPKRLDKKPLNLLFDELFQFVTLRELINDKWLSDYLIYKSDESLEFFDNINEDFKDYDQKDVLIKIKRFISHECVLNHFLSIDNGKGIGFSPNCEHAEDITKYFNNKGVPSVFISSETNKIDRRQFMQDFKHGKIKCLWNVELFTEGIDVPDCNVLLNLRLTKSIVLWHQIIGRVIRKSKNKNIAHIFDFTKNWHDLPLPDDIIWSLTEPPKNTIVKSSKIVDIKFKPDIVTVNNVVIELTYEKEYLTNHHKEELDTWVKIANDTNNNMDWVLNKFKALPNYKNLELKMIEYIKREELVNVRP